PRVATYPHSLHASHTAKKDRSASSSHKLQNDRRASSDSLRAAPQSRASAIQTLAALLCGSAPSAFRTAARPSRRKTQIQPDTAGRFRRRIGRLQNPEKCLRSLVPAAEQTRCLQSPAKSVRAAACPAFFLPPVREPARARAHSHRGFRAPASAPAESASSP